MNKRLVMCGTFLMVFLISIVGSYKFINRNNQDSTIELSAPALPLVRMVLKDHECNMLYGYVGDMDVSDVAKYVYPVGQDREIRARIEGFDSEIEEIFYEVRNNDGSRLIENGSVSWSEQKKGLFDISVKLKDLITAGEEYIFSIKLETDGYDEVCYYTRFVYDDGFDLDNQLQFVKQFHENTFDKDKATEISPYMETDRTQPNSNLGYVNIRSSAKQVMWGDLPVVRLNEPNIYITYLQDNYGGYTLEYYVESDVEGEKQYYRVVEDFLVSTFRDTMYLLDYQRTMDAVFSYEADVYQNDKINLSIQSGDVEVAESEDGNMAAFVVNGTLYYYDDNENKINYVYGFFDSANSDFRSAHFEHDMKVLQMDESGSIYYIVYGYMNRGNHEGRVGVGVYHYNGRTKLVEELGFYESSRSAAYVMQEAEKLSFLSRQGKLYLCVEGSIVSYDVNTMEESVIIPYDKEQQLFISEDHSCIAVKSGKNVMFWYLEAGHMREITILENGEIIPQGFIQNDFVYGIFEEKSSILQSDGTYAQYMKEIRIQDAEGEILKQYFGDGILISKCNIFGNQIILDRVVLDEGKVSSVTQDQIVASKSERDAYNKIVSAMTSSYQTIQQVKLKNKINTETLEHAKAKEIFFEGTRSIQIEAEDKHTYSSIHNPWRVTEYTTDAGKAMVQAAIQEGHARDSEGLPIWKKAATVTKNQILAIELETASAERRSKAICMDIMLRQIGSPQDTAAELAQGKTCQQILTGAAEEYILLDITGSDLASMLYYTNMDIPIMVLYDNGEALLITGFNQFNIVVMDPVKKKLGYMSRSDASEMLEKTVNQVFTYYRKKSN